MKIDGRQVVIRRDRLVLARIAAVRELLDEDERAVRLRVYRARAELLEWTAELVRIERDRAKLQAIEDDVLGAECASLSLDGGG